MSAQLVLVGEHNPYGADPRYALYPSPEGSSGWRLAQILDLDERAYLRLFDRHNLLQQRKWSAPLAREAAQELQLSKPDRKFVLLGRRVFDAFMTKKVGNLPKVSHEWTPFMVYERRFLALPHPSGLCRVWNLSGSVQRARAALAQFREEPVTL